MRRMNKVLLASTALCASMASGSFAAPATAPVFTWTGFYFGGNFGGVWSSDTVRDLMPSNYGALRGNQSAFNPSGILGGVQAGYNWQFDNIVVGLEGEFELANPQHRSENGPAFHSASLPSFGDLRMRAGVAIDRWLPFVTGGIVVANIKNSLTDPSFPFSVNRGGMSTGWIVGGGVEYAVDSHWSVKAEYLYMKFSDLTRSFAPSGYTYAFKFSDSAQVARVGVNFRY